MRSCPRLPALFFPLAIDAKRRPGHRLETLLGDLGTAVDAFAVRSVVDPGERRVDLAEEPLVVLLQRVVDLAVDRLRRRVGGVLVGAARDELSRLVRER